MTRLTILDRVLQQENINFVLTNRIPRRLLTRFMGWFAAIEQPVVRDLSIAAFKFFAGDPRLDEAKKTHFTSLHDCFVRELKPGARPIDRTPGTLVSPCDAIVGACGRIEDGRLIQAKEAFYALDELVVDPGLAARHRDGLFITLRLTSNMYHRFHAPFECEVSGVHYISGDTWNVNPTALKRVPRLFCRNERAVLPATLRGSSEAVTLVAVGAILVASICLTFVDVPLNAQYLGPARIACRATFEKGSEMGYFRHGSTIIVLTTPGLALTPNVREGAIVRMGEPLLQHGT